MESMIVQGCSKRRYHCTDIVRNLENFIVDNEILGGTMLPNVEQLSAQFNVSSRTMQRVMEILAQRNVIYRVRGQGSFVCEKIKPRQVSNVAVLYWDSTVSCPNDFGLNYYANERFTEEVIRRLRREENCNVKLFKVKSSTADSIGFFAFNLFDCVIAAAGFLPFCPSLLDYNRKTILVADSEFHRGDFYQSLLDYSPGFRKALRHYRDRKIRRFFVCGCNTDTSRHRYAALLEAAQQEGFDPSCFQFYATKESFNTSMFEPGMDCAEKYLALGNLRCGIFSLSDYLTLGMMKTFEKQGLVPGKDMAMTSYDNLLINIPEFKDRITFDCIEHPIEELVSATVELCHILLRNKRLKFSCMFTVPATKFIPRRSS